MCFPALAAITAQQAAVASLAITGATAVMSAAGAVQASKARNAAAVKNKEIATDAYLLKMRQENQRIYELSVQQSQKLDDANQKVLKAKSKGLAVAASAGVQGKNVQELLNDFERSEGIYTSRLDQQIEGATRQSQLNKLAYQSEALGRINGMQPVSGLATFAAAVEPLASFGLEYAGYKDRLDSVAS